MLAASPAASKLGLKSQAWMVTLEANKDYLQDAKSSDVPSRLLARSIVGGGQVAACEKVQDQHALKPKTQSTKSQVPPSGVLEFVPFTSQRALWRWSLRQELATASPSNCV